MSRRIRLPRSLISATTAASRTAAAIRFGTTPSIPALRSAATVRIQTSDTGISSFQPIAMNWS
jgi:hypothetical protein